MSAALNAEFKALVISCNLKVGSKKYNKLRKEYIAKEFDDYFGSESNLENWQKLCRDLGMRVIPGSKTGCRKAIRGVWVNIHDFLDAMRDEGICGPEHHFRSQKELSAYTLKTRKIFPKGKAKEGGPVRDLLAHIF